jgi:hypothetical protein
MLVDASFAGVVTLFTDLPPEQDELHDPVDT